VTAAPAADHRTGPERLSDARRNGIGPDGGHGLLKPQGTDEVDVRSLRRALEREVRAEVHFDAGNRSAYSHDSSNYRQAPIGVVLPRDADDIVAAVGVCREHGAPVLPRGCATSLAGQTCNVAVVIDHSKHMREIVAVDPERRTATVQPGVIRDQLSNQTEEKFNLTFAPDTSTHEYATFGGMLGNNSCGTHSVMAGRTADNTQELDILLYDGTRMRIGPTPPDELERIIAAGGRRGEIYRRLRDLRDRYADAIRGAYPDIPRRVSGYNIDELLPERGFNVARALVGSEGTLATVLEATVRLVHSPPKRSLVVCGYEDVFHAADHVPEILEFGPTGLEGLDDVLIEDMRILDEHTEDLSLLPEGKGWLLVEFGGETTEEADERAQECMKELGKVSDAPEMRLYDKQPNESRLWDVRESGLGATAFIPGEDDHWEGWEDAAVRPERLGSYLRGFRELLKRYDYRTSMYGHFGDGCIHCRIDFDLRSPGGIRKWRSFLDEAAELVLEHGGSLSGEHGDGQSRAELLEKMYGPELLEAFREFKTIWDPDNRMNPHKVVDPYPIASNLKLGAGYAPPEPETHFAYPEDGGSFAHAALRCVGAGKCRSTDSGTMCPSYMVTFDEQHSTRGRSRILYEMLQGDVITDGFRSDEVHEALDLCLSCKGCKGDCPVSVDMATYKAEFLSRHFKRRLRPPAAYSMGLIMFHSRLASLAPGLANAVIQAPGLGPVVKMAGGISRKREVPPFADQTFKSWFQGRGAVNPGGPPVVLFPDTFNNYLHPEPMKAATQALESAGFRVIVPMEHLCCGRPLYDYGMLDTARIFWTRMLDVLRPHIQAGVYVVGVEPSCVASFRDELPNMLPHDEDAKRLSLQTLTLAEFLDAHAPPDWEPPKLNRRALVHGHCHHEAVMGMDAEQKLLERMGLDFEVLDSGCCGMAGSFGFERDHYDISVKIGERRLLPAAREAGEGTLLIADGFSCKTQVKELTDRRPLHIAQVMAMARDHGPQGPPGALPERHYPDVEPASPRRAAKAAGVAVAVLGAAGAAAWLRRRRWA
jgi:FAD/FMN-containing dehydrogenase/Fe-S oxidoreductase